MENADGEREVIFGLRRNVFFLGLVSLFNDFSNEMIQSVMPAFLAVTLGVPPVGIGLIEGAADAVASFLKIFSGWFSDKIGRRKLPALLGYALSVSTRPFFALAANFSEVFGLRIIDRVARDFAIRRATRFWPSRQIRASWGSLSAITARWMPWGECWGRWWHF